ncbi:MAG: nucleotidyl transferase, partial [Chloroflexota bacterium]|nr:nucleotidyl transferase [Chloroflexota bacterium]
VEIKFFDSQGMDLDKPAERKIENTFFREDFRRVYLDEIGSIVVDQQAAESYVQAFMGAANVEAIRQASFKLVIDYSHASSALLFPNILNQLGCEVVAINSTVDELRMFRTAEQFEYELNQLAAITQTLHFDFGVRIDLGGEKIFVVDGRGRRLSRMSAFGVMAALYLRAHPGAKIAAPVTAPRLFEQLARAHGSEVIRTRVAAQGLTAAATSHQVGLAGDGDGGFIFPAFLPAFDSMLAIARLMELLASSQARLEDVADALPPFFLSSTEVSCPWDMKGKVMRVLSEQFRVPDDQQVDGIKINFDDAWVLILPDADRPLFRVLAEGRDRAHADALAAEYSNVVKSLNS